VDERHVFRAYLIDNNVGGMMKAKLALAKQKLPTEVNKSNRTA